MVNHKVSICLTTYNRSELIERSILNVLSQTHENFELFVIDDFSSIEHQVKIKALPNKIADKRVTFIFNTENKGLAFNRNQAIALSTGGYFTFKDDDDKWEQDFLFTMLNATLASDVGPDIVLTGFKSKSNNKSFCYKPISTTLFECFQSGYTPPVGGQLYNLSLVKAVGGYSHIKTGVDHDLWVNIAAFNPYVKVSFLKEPLVIPDWFSLPGQEKMTSNFDKRVMGINESLLFWRDKLTTTFGDDFYLYFCEQYNSYLCQRFLTLVVKNKDTNLLIKILKSKVLVPYIFSSVVKIIRKTFVSRLSNDSSLVPLFSRYKAKSKFAFFEKK